MAKRVLKFVGGFREFGYGNGPSLADARRSTALPNKEAVLEYLKNGATYILTPGLARDVLDPAAKDAVFMHIVTDGRYAWHLALAHYVQRYDLELPADFQEHIARNGFTIPGGINLLELDLPEDL